MPFSTRYHMNICSSMLCQLQRTAIVASKQSRIPAPFLALQCNLLLGVAVAKVSKCIFSGSKGTEYAEVRIAYGRQCQVCYSTPGLQVKSCLCAVSLQTIKNKWPFWRNAREPVPLHFLGQNTERMKFQISMLTVPISILFKEYIALKGHMEKERRKDKGGGYCPASIFLFFHSPLYLTLCGIQLPSAWQVETTGS